MVLYKIVVAITLEPLFISVKLSYRNEQSTKIIINKMIATEWLSTKWFSTKWSSTKWSSP